VGWLTRAFGGDARGPRQQGAALQAALLAVLDRDLDAAESLLSRAVKLDSQAVEPYAALARLYRVRGEVGRAIRMHQNLLLRRDLSPGEQTAVLADLAADFQQGGFLRRAIASYEELLGRDPGNRAALRALPRLLAQARSYPRAIRMARRQARIEGRDASAQEAELWVETAEAAQAEGRSEVARRAVRRALRRDRRSVRAWILRGALEAERNRPKAALAAWSRVPAIDRRAAARVYPSIEATFAALDRSRDYEVFLRRLLEQDPEDREARLALARSLAARGDADAAASELRGLLDADADDVEVRATLGRLLLAEGRETGPELAALIDALERRGLFGPREKLA